MAGLAIFMKYWDKSHLGSASQPVKPGQHGSCDQALTVSCIVTQFARETFEICRFRGLCMIKYDLRCD